VVKHLFIILQIYDFACNALEYALNREPHLFAHTKMLVDKFHYNHNHKCNPTFSLDHYPASMIDLINSSSCESTNSYTDLFKTQVAYMTQAHAMVFLKTHYGNRNYHLNQKLKTKVEWMKK
jgi:hypothetical protein